MTRRPQGAGGLRERNGRWQSSARDPRTGKAIYRTWPAGTTKREAERNHRDWLAELNQRRPADRTLTVADDQMDDAANSGPIGRCNFCPKEGIGLQRRGFGAIAVCEMHVNRTEPVFGATDASLLAALNRPERLAPCIECGMPDSECSTHFAMECCGECFHPPRH